MHFTGDWSKADVSFPCKPGDLVSAEWICEEVKMSALYLDTYTRCLLFASNLSETPLALKLGNEDTMPLVFGLLEFPSDPLPTTPTPAYHTHKHTSGLSANVRPQELEPIKETPQ